MSDHSAGILHLQILQEQAYYAARDTRQTIAEIAGHATVATIIGLANEIDEHTGADSVYETFFSTFRRSGDVEASKDAAHQQVQTRIEDQSDARRTGMRSAFKHIVATFPKAA